MLRLLIEAEYCIGCYACEVACKQEHGLPAGPRLIRVLTPPENRFPRRKKVHYYPSTCRHCGRAPCVAACPTGALFRGELGVVTVRREDCIGCRECAEACPFGIPQFHPEDGVALLCDLCLERVHAGKQPACVHHCPAQALRLGDVNSTPRLAGYPGRT